MVGVCDCCRIIEGDQSLKKVEYCSLCQAWLCYMCRIDFLRRALAASLKLSGQR